MKTKILTCILCMACLMPLSFSATNDSVIYFDSNTSAYGLKDTDGRIISISFYDGIAEFVNNRAIVQKDGLFGVISPTGEEIVAPGYKYISNYKNGYAIAFQGEFAGVLNSNGETVVPFEYEDISQFRNNNALAYKNRKLGMISTSNKVIHPFVWDEANMIDFKKDFSTFVFKQGASYGVASFTGAILMNPQEKELFHISDTQVAFVDQNKIGVMTHDATILVTPIYQSIYIAGDGYVGKNDDQFYFLNLDKGTISQAYHSVSELSENRYLVERDNKKGVFDATTHSEIISVEYDDIRLLQNPYKKDQFYFELVRHSTIQDNIIYRGVHTLEGKELIPALHSRLGFINDSLIAYYDPQNTIGIYNLETHKNSGLKYKSLKYNKTNEFGVITVKSGQFGLLDASGESLITPSTDYIYESGNFYIVEKNGKKSLYSKDKNRQTSYKFDTIFSFQNIGEKEAAIISINGLWGLLSPNGSYLVSPEFDAINEFVNGYAIVTKEGLYGFINTKGEVIIEPQFEDVSSFNEGLAIAKKNGLYGYIQPSGRFIIPAIYDNVKPFNEKGHAVVTHNDKKGIINRDGSYFLKPIYKTLIFVGDTLLIIQDNSTKQYGILKPSGEEITKIIYDDIGSFFDETTTFVQINNKYALINNKGEVLTQFIFDKMSLFNNGFATIIIGDKRGFINAKGDYILE